MFIIENYGFFIFLLVVILILIYFQNGQCFDLRKNIREEFKKERFTNQSNGSNINISDVRYLGSKNRLMDYFELQKSKKRYELPFNNYNEGYICKAETPLVPINSHPTLNFHHPYGPRKDYCY